MAKTQQASSSSDGVSDSLERLREEIGDYVTARVQHMTRSAGDRVEHLAGKVVSAPAAGARKLLRKTAVDPVKKGGHLLHDATVEPVKKAIPGLGEKKGSGGGNGSSASGGKTTTIIETIDVGVPLRICYNHWTTFDSFGEFMKGVQHVQQQSDTETDWRLKIGPSTRSWKATVQQQSPDERIEWTSEGARGTTTGVVSFHQLAPRLTRIVVVVEYSPAGFFEKTANIWRAQGRRLRLDLKRFQSHVTLAAEEDEPEGWRGEIQDAEVVRGPEDEAEDEEEDGEYEEDDDDDDDEELDDEEEEVADVRGKRGRR